MGNLLFLLAAFLLILGLVIVVGIGVGGLIHWLIPEIEWGLAILSGTAMTGLAMHLFMQLFRAFSEFRTAALLDEYVDEEEEEAVVVIEPTRRGKNRKRGS